MVKYFYQSQSYQRHDNVCITKFLNAGASKCSTEYQIFRIDMSFILFNFDNRQQIPSLQEARRANPTYMDMTSAAQGKRKLNR